MSQTVKLSEVLDAMESQGEEMSFYLDRQTGQIEMVIEEEGIGEEEDEHIAQIIEAIDSDTEGRFVALPNDFDIHEWQMMRDFADQTEDPSTREQLLRAIHGRGAFRCFRDRVAQLDVEQKWYAFRDGQYRQIAIDWCQANDIAYTQ